MSPAIALLVCGGLSGIAKERNGDYLDIYRTFLQATSPAQINHPQFTLDPYFIAREPSAFPNEDQYDCIMLTGSGTVNLLRACTLTYPPYPISIVSPTPIPPENHSTIRTMSSFLSMTDIL